MAFKDIEKCKICGKDIFFIEKITVDLPDSGPCPLHRNCFVCYHCNIPLDQDHYYQVGGTLADNSQEMCSNCGLPVYATERVVITEQQQAKIYHKSCLRCSMCSKVLDSASIGIVNSKFYCSNHYTLHHKKNVKATKSAETLSPRKNRDSLRPTSSEYKLNSRRNSFEYRGSKDHSHKSSENENQDRRKSRDYSRSRGLNNHSSSRSPNNSHSSHSSHNSKNSQNSHSSNSHSSHSPSSHSSHSSHSSRSSHSSHSSHNSNSHSSSPKYSHSSNSHSSPSSRNSRHSSHSPHSSHSSHNSRKSPSRASSEKNLRSMSFDVSAPEANEPESNNDIPQEEEITPILKRHSDDNYSDPQPPADETKNQTLNSSQLSDSKDSQEKIETDYASPKGECVGSNGNITISQLKEKSGSQARLSLDENKTLQLKSFASAFREQNGDTSKRPRSLTKDPGSRKELKRTGSSSTSFDSYNSQLTEIPPLPEHHNYIFDDSDDLEDYQRETNIVKPCPGFRTELGGSKLAPISFCIEDKEKFSLYYNDNISKESHWNWIGGPEKFPYVISVLKQRDENNKVLALIRTKKEDKIEKFDFFSNNIKPGKILKILKQKFISEDLKKEKFILIKDNVQKKIIPELIHMEDRLLIKNYNMGVIYCKEGQGEFENDMFCNNDPSPEFEEFLEFLGEKVELKGYQGFKGGLDVKADTTGKYSIVANEQGIGFMFHVSTFLPFEPNPQQIKRKRHIGNDVVVIIFQDGPTLFHPSCMSSQFNHVYVVIQYDKVKSETNKTTHYKVSVVSKSGVLSHGPALLNRSVYPKNNFFREFLFAKLINSERKAYNSSSFAVQRTRKEWLNNLQSNYM